jgi:hypothetical protein
MEVSRSVSEDAPCLAFARACSPFRSRPRPSSSGPARDAASSPVLVRFPLCASAIDPVAVDRNVGWALAQTLDQDLGPVADRDAGGLLAPVLQGVETEIGEFGDLFTRGPDPEDATGVLRAQILGVKVMGEPTIATSHSGSLREVRGLTGHQARAGHR